MRLLYELMLWALFVLRAVADDVACPGKGGCEYRQIGTPQFVTRLLQCNGSNCQSAVFADSPRGVCLIRSGSTVRIYLSSCTEYSKNTGFFISNTAGVVPSREGLGSSSTSFKDTGCGTFCQAVETTYYTAASNGNTLIADNTQISTSSRASCAHAFYVFPDATAIGACNGSRPGGPSGPSGQSGPPGVSGLPGQKGDVGQPPRRRCPSQTRQRVLLTITDGVSVFAVGPPVRLSYESYRLPIVEERNGEVFYVQKYASRAVGANGTIESVTACTLQLARSKMYLVADVLDDTTLNYTRQYSTGLNLKDASEFPGGYAPEPDYRFFIQYDVTFYSFTASVFCPLFHRNHCIYPGISGSLRLIPIKRTDRSLEPTFVNPTHDVLRRFLISTTPAESEGLWRVSLSVL